MIRLAIASCTAAFTGTVGAVIAQTPVTTEVGEWSKYGVAGACLAVSGWLIVVTIPKIMESHQKSFDSLRGTMEKGFEDVGSEINKGNDRVATLLQSTLVQVIQERHNNK